MPRRPTQAFYANIEGLKANIKDISAEADVFNKNFVAVADKGADIDGKLHEFSKRLHRLEGAHNNQELRIARLEAHHWHTHWRYKRWVPRALMFGISPSSRKFVASEPAVASLRQLGYEGIDQMLEVRGTAELDPPAVIHSKWADEHKKRPDKISEPPELTEIEEFWKIAQEMMRPEAD